MQLVRVELQKSVRTPSDTAYVDACKWRAEVLHMRLVHRLHERDLNMYQTFESPPAGSFSATADRVKRLRAAMAEADVDAWLVPRADEHQGEYVPASAERLKWITGFSGSAGMAVIAKRTAALFVDGRYTVQSRQQVDTALFSIQQIPEAKVSDWLAETLSRDAVVGFDPWLHTLSEIEQRTTDLARKGIKLKPIRRNLVDQVWGQDRPPPPMGTVTPQPLELAGRSAEEKIAAVQKELADAEQDAVVLTLPDSIAWLFNIRGQDVAHNPVPLSFAVVPRTGKPSLFIAAAKLATEAKVHLEAVATIEQPKALSEKLAALRRDTAKVRIDPATAAFAVAQALGGAKRVARGKDPCIDAKAVKTPAEIKGARAAQERDGVALVRCMAWLDADHGGPEARAVPPRYRCAGGDLVRYDLGLRPQWRHRALPRHRGDQSPARAG